MQPPTRSAVLRLVRWCGHRAQPRDGAGAVLALSRGHEPLFSVATPPGSAAAAAVFRAMAAVPSPSPASPAAAAATVRSPLAPGVFPTTPGADGGPETQQRDVRRVLFRDDRKPPPAPQPQPQSQSQSQPQPQSQQRRAESLLTAALRDNDTVPALPAKQSRRLRLLRAQSSPALMPRDRRDQPPAPLHTPARPIPIAAGARARPAGGPDPRLQRHSSRASMRTLPKQVSLRIGLEGGSTAIAVRAFEAASVADVISIFLRQWQGEDHVPALPEADDDESEGQPNVSDFALRIAEDEEGTVPDTDFPALSRRMLVAEMGEGPFVVCRRRMAQSGTPQRLQRRASAGSSLRSSRSYGLRESAMQRLQRLGSSGGIGRLLRGGGGSSAGRDWDGVSSDDRRPRSQSMAARAPLFARRIARALSPATFGRSMPWPARPGEPSSLSEEDDAVTDDSASVGLPASFGWAPGQPLPTPGQAPWLSPTVSLMSLSSVGSLEMNRDRQISSGASLGDGSMSPVAEEAGAADEGGRARQRSSASSGRWPLSPVTAKATARVRAALTSRLPRASRSLSFAAFPVTLPRPVAPPASPIESAAVPRRLSSWDDTDSGIGSATDHDADAIASLRLADEPPSPAAAAAVMVEEKEEEEGLSTSPSGRPDLLAQSRARLARLARDMGIR